MLMHYFLPTVVKSIPAVLHFLAVFLSVWLGGFYSGLFCTLLSSWFTIMVVRPYLIPFPITDTLGGIRVLMFFGSAFFFLVALHVMRKALTEAQMAISLRDDFLNMISHELKTPITALKLNMGIVRGIILEENPKTASVPQINASIRQINRLERLVSSMMDLSHFDSGHLVLIKRKCDLKKIIQDVLHSFQNDSITLNANQSVEGIWDQVRVEQIVSNLIHNAIKYGQGKPIEISLGSEENTAWFSVKDQGAGIDHIDHQRIFERFQRINSISDVQGMGLGLYLTKRLVEIHGGKIDVKSQPGDGALFKVHLPIDH